MNEEIQHEVEAINSIYGEDTLRKFSDPAEPEEYVLKVPLREVTLRLSVPDQYPDKSLHFTAVEGVGPTSPKGFGKHVLITARDVLERVFTPGQVCLFDLLQELEQVLDEELSIREEDPMKSQRSEEDHRLCAEKTKGADAPHETRIAPQWALSTTVTEKKSVFLARACTVNSTIEAQSAITHLLSTDKRAGKATHNISAYRIRMLFDGNEVVSQDCDDDGEDAAGGRLLRLLQMMDVWNILVVVSRWYGGVKLGPARFGIINAVAREAVVEGGHARD